LLKRGIARESDGAIVIFFGAEEPPALIRKKDGAFTYTTTDLATIRYRVERWRPAAILYVVDSRQALHFKNLFEAARRWGYADISQNRTTDYVFSWDKMLAMDGNTATYMQYAYARIRSIFRKGEEDVESFRRQPPLPYLEQPQERVLALQLLRLEEILQSAAVEYKPNILTAYLWDLAKSY